MQQTAEKNKVQVEIRAEHAPNQERMLRALMRVLNVEPSEVERLLQERRERVTENEGMAA